MSTRHFETVEYPSPKRVEEIVRNARRERAEAIAQLFGFGFTVLLKDAVSRRHRDKAAEPKLRACVVNEG
jgi:hypothetical protein